MSNFSAVSDLPVESLDGDYLSNNKYAKGLSDFIRQADTPLTIGIQGGWGSGKTSLLNMLKLNLMQGERDSSVLCIWINAWQHSLFQAQNQGAVAASLLGGMVSGIEDAVEGSKEIETGIKARLGKLSEKLGPGVVALGRFAGGIAAVGVNMAMHGLPHHIIEAAEGGMEAISEEKYSSPAKIIQNLRNDLSNSIHEVIAQGKVKRFVFFVDDLDRVPPETAVEILDVLKNVFDVPDCVFVLAVDFDVVVKGLKGKFGELSSENSREFRQYFDKIIQVPFSMPVAAYESTVARLVEELVRKFNLGVVNEFSTTELAEVAWAITDGTPRSIKRIVNTLSLLNMVRRNDSNAADDSAEMSGEALIVWFALVGMQINFPTIYRQLERSPDFLSWEPADVLPLSAQQQQSASNANDLDDEHLSSNFLKSLDLLCAQSSWLREKESALRVTFSALVQALKRMDGESVANRSGTPSLEFLREVLNSASVTSLDSAPVSDDVLNIRKDEISQLARRIHQEIPAGKLPEMEKGDIEKRYAKQFRAIGRGGRRYWIPCREGKNSFLQEISLEFQRTPRDVNSYTLYITIHVKAPHGKAPKYREALAESYYGGVEYVKPYGVRISTVEVQKGGDMAVTAANAVSKLMEFVEKTRKHVESKV